MEKKILIVDDEPEQIDFATTVLEQNGYITISAKNGIEGMQKAKIEKPDLILLDILMPRRGGIAMYQDLRHDEETKDIPVVIVTGATRGGPFEEYMLSQGQDIPAPDGYVEKPMNPDTVLKLVSNLLGSFSYLQNRITF
ncbi:MAG: response regulator [Desulfobacteraceae bacterium]|nr:response regulator [Desulfobacteraceae bacterium]